MFKKNTAHQQPALISAIHDLPENQRERILEEIKNIRLEARAATGRIYHPGPYERIMFRFANWMIAAGQRLRRRYEIPSFSQSPLRVRCSTK